MYIINMSAFVKVSCSEFNSLLIVLFLLVVTIPFEDVDCKTLISICTPRCMVLVIWSQDPRVKVWS